MFRNSNGNSNKALLTYVRSYVLTLTYKVTPTLHLAQSRRGQIVRLEKNVFSMSSKTKLEYKTNVRLILVAPCFKKSFNIRSWVPSPQMP